MLMRPGVEVKEFSTTPSESPDGAGEIEISFGRTHLENANCKLDFLKREFGRKKLCKLMFISSTTPQFCHGGRVIGRRPDWKVCSAAATIV